MAETGQLSVNDRVLLHLSRFATDIPPEEFPPETTQSGIASAVGISRTHVPRAVKSLLREGAVSELTARVRGHERRMNVYVLNPEGLRRAEELWNNARVLDFRVTTEGRTTLMKGSQIEAAVGKKRAVGAVSQMREGLVEIDSRRRPPVKELKTAPAFKLFFGREAELKEMDEFMESGSKVLVVLGNHGYGASALARRFADEQDDLDILWVELARFGSASDLDAELRAFGEKVKKEAKTTEDVLGIGSVLIVFDGYYSVVEEIVEFFGSMIDRIGEAKVIVTARQETPAYNWFYHKREVDSGTVRELRIKGLDEASALRLLGIDNLDKDAVHRIMIMTRGQPLTLMMLRERDEAGLRKNGILTPEEIRYLLFLTTKTS